MKSNSQGRALAVGQTSIVFHRPKVNRQLSKVNCSVRGFTLLELLIVIGILAILATTATLVLNPVEMLRQARDSKRVNDLRALNQALSVYELNRTASFGSSSVVYVSIPDTSASCTSLGLPSLPSGWTYACKTTDSYRKVDGTGWVPVNFTAVPGGSPLSVLPIDPVNATTTGLYYTYVTGGSWELNTRLESGKHGYGGSASKTNSDGGNNDYLYEIGTNLALILDNENYVRDGDMELSDVSNWVDYSYNPPPPTKTKDTSTVGSGLRSLRLITADAGYEGITQSFLSSSKKIYIQMSYKVAPAKAIGWECYCSNLGCCWRTVFNNSTMTNWTRLSQIDDISESTGLTNIYISQQYGTASEFWLDDVIVRPVY